MKNNEIKNCLNCKDFNFKELFNLLNNVLVKTYKPLKNIIFAKKQRIKKNNFAYFFLKFIIYNKK